MQGTQRAFALSVQDIVVAFSICKGKQICLFCWGNLVFGPHYMCKEIVEGSWKSGCYSQLVNTQNFARIANLFGYVGVLSIVRLRLRKNLGSKDWSIAIKVKGNQLGRGAKAKGGSCNCTRFGYCRSKWAVYVRNKCQWQCHWSGFDARGMPSCIWE